MRLETGEPVVMYMEKFPSYEIGVKVFRDNEWVDLGTPGFSTGIFEYKAAVFDNTIYIAYKVRSNSLLYVKKYDGTDWVNVGPSLHSTWVSSFFDIQVGGDGNPQVAMIDNNSNTTLKKWNGTAWATLTTLPRDIYSSYSHLKISISEGNTFIAYNYGQSIAKLGVKKYNGTSLSQVGPAELTQTNLTTHSLSSKNGQPFLFMQDAEWANKFVLKSFDNTSWSVMDAKPFTPKGAQHTSVVVSSSNQIYSSFQDFSEGGKISVMNYKDGVWHYVGAPGFSPFTGVATAIAVDNHDSLYVAYRNTGSTNFGKLMVFKFNGTSWRDISVGGFFSDRPDDITMKFSSNNTLYISYLGRTNNAIVNYGYAYRYIDGTGWASLPSFESNYITNVQIEIDANDNPVVAYTEYRYTYRMYVKRFNGSSWVNVTTGDVSPGGAHTACIGKDNDGVLYIGYADWLQGFRLVIKKLSGSSWVLLNPSPVTTVGITKPHILFDDDNNLSLFYLQNNMVVAKKYTGADFEDLGNSNFTNISSDNLSVVYRNGSYVLVQDIYAGFAFKLTVHEIEAPVIDVQPQSQTAVVGDAVVFSVEASGDGDITYQWYFE
ncbi:MAG: immunoglobulin domain-containing protein, partial [Cytophagaceae bacterium]